MTARNGNTTLLILGHAIKADGDELSLTDMWQAAGSDPAKAPAEWRRSTQGMAFIEFVASNLVMGNAHVIRTERGRNAATWGHWQIGMAYAQYLSPRFQAACNSVVRAYIEGRGQGSGSLAARRVRVAERNTLYRHLNLLYRHMKLIERRFLPQQADRAIAQLYQEMGIELDPLAARSHQQGELDIPEPKQAGSAAG